MKKTDVYRVQNKTQFAKGKYLNYKTIICEIVIL